MLQIKIILIAGAIEINVFIWDDRESRQQYQLCRQPFDRRQTSIIHVMVERLKSV